MTDIFDERRKGLESDYFRRKDKEALDRLREALHAEARERGEESATMACPRCDGRLREMAFEDIHIDRCDKCEGIWLDAGELEKITQQDSSAGGWLKAFWPGRTSE